MQRVDDAINQLCVYDYQVLCTSLMLLSVEVGIGPSRTSTSMFFRLTMDDRISNTARNGHSKESCKLQTPSNSKVLLILIFHSYFIHISFIFPHTDFRRPIVIGFHQHANPGGEHQSAEASTDHVATEPSGEGQ